MRKVFLIVGLVQLALIPSIFFGEAVSSPFTVTVQEVAYYNLAVFKVELLVLLLLLTIIVLQRRSFSILGFRVGMRGGIYLINEKQSVEALTCSFAQLTGQIKKQDKDLRTNYQKAVMANKAKSDFIINISHELRTPMHAILNFAEISQNKVMDGNQEKLKFYFSRIEESGERLLLLINRLLDLSSLEAGRHSFIFRPYDMRKCIEESIAGILPLVDQKGLKVIIEQKVKDPCWPFDKSHIIQVIVNLLSNAVKFSPKNKQIIIKIEKKKMQLGKSVEDCLCISFVDEGMGIPEEEVEIIFDKFMQSSLTDHSIGGTGLGLAICREIIKAHQGKIWAENNKGVGATVAFAIPNK